METFKDLLNGILDEGKYPADVDKNIKQIVAKLNAENVKDLSDKSVDMALKGIAGGPATVKMAKELIKDGKITKKDIK